MKLKIWRDGKIQDVSVTLGELPETGRKRRARRESSEGGLEGVEVQRSDSGYRAAAQLPSGTQGVVVTQVDPSSPRAVGLERGMVIQEVNHKPVNNIEQYKQALAGAGNQPVLLLVNQGGVTRYLVVESH